VLKETLVPAKLNASRAMSIPEETAKSSQQVSRDSVAYFENLRKKHLKEQSAGPVPAYAELIGVKK